MSKLYDPNSEHRAHLMMTVLNNAHRKTIGGAHGILVRIALATMYMFLVVMSHQLMGITGVAYISVLFIILVVTPFLEPLFKKRISKKQRKPRPLFLPHP